MTKALRNNNKRQSG